MPQLGISNSLVYPNLVQEAVAANSYYLPLNGTTQYASASVTAPSFADTSFTISMWVRVTFGAIHPLFTITPGGKNAPLIYLDINSSNELQFVVNDGTSILINQISTAAIPSGLSDTWMNVVVILDKGNDITFMANGVKVGNVIPETESTVLSITGDIFLGNRNLAFLNGSLDTTTIWRSALNELEITELYNAGQTADVTSDAGDYSSSADLVAWYKMGDGTEAGTGSTIYDMSGDSRDPNNLTITGGATFATL